MTTMKLFRISLVFASVFAAWTFAESALFDGYALAEKAGTKTTKDTKTPPVDPCTNRVQGITACRNAEKIRALLRKAPPAKHHEHAKAPVSTLKKP